MVRPVAGDGAEIARGRPGSALGAPRAEGEASAEQRAFEESGV